MLGDQRRRRWENGSGALDGGQIRWYHNMIDEQSEQSLLAPNSHFTDRIAINTNRVGRGVPRLGVIQSKWVALMIGFITNTYNQSYHPYLTFQDDWYYKW